MTAALPAVDEQAGLELTCLALCQRRHPAEWDARVPRVRACSDCAELAWLAIETWLASGRVR